MAEYLRANEDPLALDRLPEGFSYAGVAACAGALFTPGNRKPTWKTEPAPFLFFHGTADPLIPYGEGRNMTGPDAIIPTLPENTPFVFYSMVGMNHDASSIPTSYMNHALSAFVEQYVLGEDSSRVRVEERLLDQRQTRFQRYLLHGNPYSLEEIMQAATVIWDSYND